MARFTTNRRSCGSDILKGAAAGLAGGLVASWVMTQFQNVWSTVSSKLREPQAKPAESESKSEPSTVKLAERISSDFLGHELTSQEKRLAGPAVHYAFGSSMGAVYGVAAELMPRVMAGQGMLFGTGLWFMADEVAVPAMGLSGSPIKTPATTHVYALASHLVYGLTAETVRSAVRPLLKSSILRGPER